MPRNEAGRISVDTITICIYYIPSCPWWSRASQYGEYLLCMYGKIEDSAPLPGRSVAKARLARRLGVRGHTIARQSDRCSCQVKGYYMERR